MASILDLGTPATRELAEQMSAQCGGVCILSFSRGKDSLACWLWLREFFPRIIPFHCALVPHMQFVDESLAHYEEFFGVKIERMLHHYVGWVLTDMAFQVLEDEEDINASGGWWQYDSDEIAELLKVKYDCPQAWLAYGITGTDNPFRRKRMIQGKGRQPERRVFYPCYDWTREQLTRIIEVAGCGLPVDYCWDDRSFNNLFNWKVHPRIRECYPKDWEKLELFCPLLRACEARQIFRRGHKFAESEPTLDPSSPADHTRTAPGS